MKKILVVFIFILTFLAALNTQKANAETNFYAKIQSSNVYLYSQTNKTALFEIPYSYFVKVEKNEVTLMNGTPQNPYANSSFKVFISNYIYSSPNQASTIQNSISTSDSLKYYGKIEGQQISSTSNVWYYCSIQKDGQIFFGYVFSGITDYLSPIQTNNESFENVDEDVLSASPYSQITTLSTKTKILLIVSIALPSIIILYFLIKPNRIQITKTKKQIKNQKKKSFGDYYEFDENDL